MAKIHKQLWFALKLLKTQPTEEHLRNGLLL